MEPGEIFDDEFNFSAQVHRVFESVENVSDIMKKHLETVKKDKELERVRNEIKATKVESLQTELRMLVAENQALKEKENQSKLNNDRWFLDGIYKYKPSYKSLDLLKIWVLSLNSFFLKNPLQDFHSSLNAVISTNESTEFMILHVIYNQAYTYKFQLKTTIVC